MAETDLTKPSRRASGGSGADAQSGGSVAAAPSLSPSLSPSPEWQPFTPAAVLGQIGAGTVFTARLPDNTEVPAVANCHGQILDPVTQHLLRNLPTHFSKTVA